MRYAEVASALAVVAPAAMPGSRGELLTTAQLAEKLQLSTKTVLRRARKGDLGELLRPVRLAARGRGAVRWAAEVGR
jgi:hypothetical protein